MTEASLLRACQRYLDRIKDKDVWYLKTHGSRYGRAGVPDLILCVSGDFVAVELKLPGKKPTKLQNRELRAIKNAMGGSYVVHSVDELKDVVAAHGAVLTFFA